jgi:hypothetical protein
MIHLIERLLDRSVIFTPKWKGKENVLTTLYLVFMCTSDKIV